MFDMILIRYLALACKTRIDKKDVAIWKRIEQVREDFTCFIRKTEKDKPLFRTIDKALNDAPTHPLHCRLEKRKNIIL